MRTELSLLNIRLQSLAIFRTLLADPVIKALCGYLDSLEDTDVTASVSRYAAFVSALYSTEKRTLAGYIQSIVNNDENAYIRMIGKGAQPWPEMESTLWAELEILQQVADLTPGSLRAGLQWQGILPTFAVKELDIAASYRERCGGIDRFGYGIYAKHHLF